MWHGQVGPAFCTTQGHPVLELAMDEKDSGGSLINFGEEG